MATRTAASIDRDRHWSIAPSCELRHDPDAACVEMIWQGYLTSDAFRAANERVLALIAKTGVNKLLGDVTHFTLIGAEDQRWLNENWIPRIIAAGLRTCALVQPLYYFNRVAVESVGGRVDPQRLTVRYFSDPDEARAWLRSA